MKSEAGAPKKRDRLKEIAERLWGQGCNDPEQLERILREELKELLEAAQAMSSASMAKADRWDIQERLAKALEGFTERAEGAR